MLKTKREIFYVIVGLAVGAVLGYGNTLSGDFHFDDFLVIVNNPAVKSLDNIPLIWQAFNTRFLTGLSFAVNYALGGLSVEGYHAVNIVIHWANAVLVYGLVRWLGQTPVMRRRLPQPLSAYPTAWLAAFLFLLHPLQTQAVSYITQRAAVLAAFFYLSSLLAYVMGRLQGRPFWRWLSLVLAILGMLTKEMTATLPFMLLVVEIYFFKTSETGWKQTLKPVIIFTPLLFLIPAVLWSDATNSLLSLKSQTLAASFRWDNLWTEINVLKTYLRLFIFPVNQNLDYDYPVYTLFHPWTLFSLAFLGGLLVMARRQFAADRLLSFCVSWFFITTAVEFSACALIAQDMIFEHYLYLPMVGLSIAAAGLLSRIPVRQFSGAALVLLITLTVLTHQRNKIWQDEFTLWQDVVAKSPRKARGYVNLGLAHRWDGQLEQAKINYEKALSLPITDSLMHAQLYVNLGAVYGRQGDYQREVEYCRRAIVINPYNAQAHSNLGYAYLLSLDYGQALAYGERAVMINPDFAEANNNLGVIYGSLGEYEKARDFFQRAFRLDPDNHEAQKNLELARRFASPVLPSR